MRNPFVFDKILATAVRSGRFDVRTREAVQWFRGHTAELATGVGPRDSMADRDRFKTGLTFGSMYCYTYDPKWKYVLPYYDRFPLIFPIGPAPGGWLGLNMHYLPPPWRARLMDALDDLKNNNRYSTTTKLKLSYDILNGAAKLKYFRPCLKHYLTKHVRSFFVKIEPVEWNIALFLPVERFEKKTKEQVWEESKRIIRNYR